MSEPAVESNPLAHIEDDEEHDNELWLVSYADMVTLLFGFFVILFSLSDLDDKKFDQMTARMAEAFKANDGKKSAETDAGVSTEARQLRALQMLVAMLNLGDSVDDAVPKIEKSFAEGKAVEGAKISFRASMHPRPMRPRSRPPRRMTFRRSRWSCRRRLYFLPAAIS
jgi:hypothetical protein